MQHPASDQRHDPPAHPRPVSTETRGLRWMQDVHATPARDVPRLTRAQRQALYNQMVAELKARYKIAIRKWRSHMSGVAYELKYADGTIKRMISAPRPRSPVSAAIFLHEVGHHAIGFRRYTSRPMEEYYVWQWAFREMVQRGIPLTPAVIRHYRRSMHHYVRTARKRGVRDIPHELHHFHAWPG